MAALSARPTIDSQPDAGVLLGRMITGHWVAQMVHVAAKLGIADLVADGSLNCVELAERTGTHAPSLYRVLRGLASVGVFVEDEVGRFGLNPPAELLRSDVAGSMRDWAVLQGDSQLWRPWGELLHCVRTGETAFRYVYGMTNWEYRAQHPEANDIFNAAMLSRTGRSAAAIAAGYDFSGLGTIVDVGGGHGSLLAAILQRYPDARGVLLDLPHVVVGARQFLEKSGVADRCEIVVGNFFEAAPEGGDAYILKSILHDWGDEASKTILNTCRRAMRRDSKLLVVEMVVPPPNTPHPATLLDLNMLVMNEGGRERTEAEFEVLLKEAGFALEMVVSTGTDHSVIVATPI